MAFRKRNLRLALVSVTAVLCIGGSAGLAAGEDSSGTAKNSDIYQWTDHRGRLHFSQDISKVPPAKRAQAKANAKQAAKQRRTRDPLQVYGGPSPARRDGARMERRLTHNASRVMRIPFERHGTLMRVNVKLNDRVTAPFFIDTGASGVSIPWSVTQKLGLKITADTPRINVMTANGMVSEPVVQLSSVQLGPARVTNLKAAVSGSMDIGLLGGAFFNNYVYQVDAASGVITLKPNLNVRGGLNQSQWRAKFDTIREPLIRLEAYLAEGGFTEEARVRELEEHRGKLRASLEELEQEANKHSVPRGWRE